MLILWHAFFLRPFSNAPRKKKKNEPLSKNGNCRIGRKTQNQICRGHVGSGSSIRSIHRLHSIPLHCIAFHRSIPLHSTALHSIDPSTPSHSTKIHSTPFHSMIPLQPIPLHAHGSSRAHGRGPNMSSKLTSPGRPRPAGRPRPGLNWQAWRGAPLIIALCKGFCPLKRVLAFGPKKGLFQKSVFGTKKNRAAKTKINVLKTALFGTTTVLEISCWSKSCLLEFFWREPCHEMDFRLRRPKMDGQKWGGALKIKK